jgi:Family of unknown function (DUF6893)
MPPLKWSNIADPRGSAADLLRTGAARARRFVEESNLQDVLPADPRRLGLAPRAQAGGPGRWGWALLGLGAAVGVIIALQLADIRRYVKMRTM